MNCELELYLQNDKLPLEEIEGIYKSCGWGSGEAITKAIKGSFCCVLARSEGVPVGFARIISDGVAYALLVDTMVPTEFKRNGIGSMLVTKLIEYCRSKKIFIMKLISSKEGKQLYLSLGFEQCSNEEPGMTLQL